MYVGAEVVVSYRFGRKGVAIGARVVLLIGLDIGIDRRTVDIILAFLRENVISDAQFFSLPLSLSLRLSV